MNNYLRCFLLSACVPLLSACGNQSSGASSSHNSNMEKETVQNPVEENAPSVKTEVEGCEGRAFDLATFTNPNWIEGKQRDGSGLMFEGLSEEEFILAESIYFPETAETREIVARKGEGQRLKYFIPEGEPIRDIAFEKVCINFRK